MCRAVRVGHGVSSQSGSIEARARFSEKMYTNGYYALLEYSSRVVGWLFRVKSNTLRNHSAFELCKMNRSRDCLRANWHAHDACAIVNIIISILYNVTSNLCVGFRAKVSRVHLMLIIIAF